MPIAVRAMTPCASSCPAPERVRAEPFRNAEQAWFWTMGALAARRAGAGSGGHGVPRPCDPDDVLKCLDQLYRRRRIDLVHARILRIWGERRTAPNPAYATERCDWRLWKEAMERLEWPLRVKGIIG
ncbi:hypothetical protein [Limobrevibacterium gyesilva]|uniref:Uncharacterized protein n=1 Tax=Limobrevibacterium gyesilva TaxID=2991712 RepID=A0AA41YME8_9PROT|nr:hypothetical protein [Limobrevibacterium gyesilva]MCW3476586.1 hypothetical protein [Limobrevibacterium gyesilva]